jgi:hypothetical protein
MARILSIVLFLAALAASSQTDSATADKPAVISGKKFVFTVTAPSGWVLDIKQAEKFKVKAWFRPERNPSETKTYIYAYGVDNDEKPNNYERFIKKDQQSWRKKYPKLESQRVTLDISGALRNACVFRMTGIADRFKQEVVYIQAEKAVFVLVFSAESKGYYNHYGEDFDTFTGSLDYLGDKPEKILKERQDAE